MTSVSIGMPVYNAEKYLDGALASLSAQTFSDLQIVISDNASTDSTPDIISTWAARDARIIFHRQIKNIGAMPNFEWVLRQVASPWFMFSAYDDLWSPNYVDVLYHEATAKPDIKLAAPLIVQVNRDGNENRRRPFYEPICTASRFGRVWLSIRHVRSAWCYGLFNRNALIDAWGKSRGFKYTWAQDFLMMLPILLTGDVTGSNDAIFYQRITNVSDAYVPSTLSSQKDIFSSFFRESLHILRDAPLSSVERAVLYPLIMHYADRHAWRVHRLIRSSIKEFFSVRKST
jgi:glycosyltransferase involved in cell wall biosynthesis